MKSLSIFSSNAEYADVQKFLIKLAVFLSVPVLLISGLALFLFSYNALPAPVLTGRVSFDEKARYIRLHPFESLNILATGSSMTLYNLSSDIIFDKTSPNIKYFNFASWGMKAEDSTTFLDYLTNKFEPETIIIVTSPFDFYTNDNPLRLDVADYDRYISGTNSLYFYTRYHDPSLLWRARTLHEQRTQNNIYLSLKFDQGGGVSIDPPRMSISKGLWNAKFEPHHLNETNYVALEEHVKELSAKGILTIIIQSPMRSHFLNDDKAAEPITKHWQRLDKIASENGGYFVNMHAELSLGDEYFVDWGHLNSRGSKIFTQKLFEKLEQDGIFANGQFTHTTILQADLPQN